MWEEIRWKEYGIMLYRLFLAYAFYFIARLLFYYFNKDVLDLNNWIEFFRLSYYGIAFDTTAILYLNALFIQLSILPLFINRKKYYQKLLFWAYFIPNTIGYALNFIDIPYYPFSRARFTLAAKNILENEQNKGALFKEFIISYWYVFLLFFTLLFLWVKLYGRIKISFIHVKKPIPYLTYSIIGITIASILIIGGVRGGFKHSTRPINMIDASKHVKKPNHADIVLNSTFSFFRTINKTSDFTLHNWVDSIYIKTHIKPIKQYSRQLTTKPNIVIFILESMGREYWGAMNQGTAIPNFKSHTPFLDSLATESFVFDNGFANGRQSIHAMAAVLAGIPSFKTAFTSSPYAKQPIESIVSICNQQGYSTSFFHGAPNGSMGFLGFGNILGFNNYYGKKEYGDNDDYDGIWGIWDEPFLQYMSRVLSHTKEPFLGTVFTISSHHPFAVPKKYDNIFKDGEIPMHKCVEYADYSVKKFFDRAKKEPWFNNTIFVFTADHTNLTYYDEYKKTMNRYAVPIMFYSANKQLVKKGKSGTIAEQIDIYPTLIDLMGYQKPFRSWGRSLFSNKKETPRAINSTASSIYQMMQGKYIYIFDSKRITGIFSINDLALTNNLISKIQAQETVEGEKQMKAFIQDYTDRIINKKLSKH